MQEAPVQFLGSGRSAGEGIGYPLQYCRSSYLFCKPKCFVILDMPPVKVVQYNINTEELYSYLKEFIHILYFRHLLVNPRDRRVVVIESVLCPSHFRETLTRVLFKYFEVPSVLLAPSHLMALLTLGINSAMVLDCGYRESLVLPVSFLSVQPRYKPMLVSKASGVGNSAVGTMYC
ncbi:hypothetical protein FD754_019301 [Muntiacus muntjak]|uniref:Actin-related protein 10 n=1 Tax=Muntiacus muntjak TaxID=9888 RepID=A0A5N3UZU1_MUNMU|nr:hypothetical protein FD754_019301 [Muntiacus muntjak]